MKAILIGLMLGLSACQTTPTPTAPEDCTPPAPTEVKNLYKPAKAKSRKSGKNYVIWNKNEFLKPRGLVTMAKSKIFTLADVHGAENLKPLETINGFTVKNAKSPVTVNAGPDWVVQEEVEYHALETLYRITPVENPGGPCPAPRPCPNPRPCPVEPGPGPTPDPGPAPTPVPAPVNEQARSWGVSRMKAIEAKGKVDTSKVKVCVVDTGIDMSHPDKGNVVATVSFTGEPVSPDVGQHGSHVASTIAARLGSGLGVSQAALYVCKGLSNNGSGSSSSLAQCLTWCGQQGAAISSNSWGSTQPDQMIQNAVQRLTSAGIAVVVANGNDSRGQLNHPAAMAATNPLVFGIAASDQGDRKAQFSTYGTGTKFIAPGVDIVGNRPGGGTQTMSGTSMATPGVAGAMAYCIAMGKPVTCLKTDALNLPANQQGAGLPNLWTTVNQ